MVKKQGNEKFSNRLKEYRLAAGYKTGKDFVEEIKKTTSFDIPYTSYMNYENKGVEPKYEVLCKIADFLNVSLDDLLGRESVQFKKAREIFSLIGGNLAEDETGEISIKFQEEYGLHKLDFPTKGDLIETLGFIKYDEDLINALIKAIDHAVWIKQIKPRLDAFCDNEKTPTSNDDDVTLFEDLYWFWKSENLHRLEKGNSFLIKGIECDIDIWSVKYVMSIKGHSPIWREIGDLSEFKNYFRLWFISYFSSSHLEGIKGENKK